MRQNDNFMSESSMKEALTEDEMQIILNHQRNWKEWFKMPAKYFIKSDGSVIGERIPKTPRKFTIATLSRIERLIKWNWITVVIGLLMVEKEADEYKDNLYIALLGKTQFNPLIGYIYMIK